MIKDKNGQYISMLTVLRKGGGIMKLDSPKLSVIVNSYNEERCIKRCLDSIKDVADEIIVIDSQSTDNTKEIIKKLRLKKIKNEKNKLLWMGQENESVFVYSEMITVSSHIVVYCR